MGKALTIEELKNRIGKPVFVIATKEEFKHRTAWYILSKISAFKLDNESNGYVEFTDCKCIKFENIQFFRFFDTEATEKELAEILDAEEKEKTGYERAGERENYYTINTSKEVIRFTDDEFSEIHAEKRFEVASYFNDKKLAENIARAEILKNQLRRYAALNGGIPSQKDWKNSHVAKYELIGESGNFIHATKNFESRAIGAIYFKDIKACEKAIEIFKDELIWYFTEFQEQLY